MYRNYIDVEFSYNGDLGVLQQKTNDNKYFLGKLLMNDVIERDAWRDGIKAINQYFTDEIKKVLENPLYYIN